MQDLRFVNVLCGLVLLGACSSSSDETRGSASLNPSAGSGGALASGGAGGTGAAPSATAGATASAGASAGETGPEGALPIDGTAGASAAGVGAASDAGGPTSVSAGPLQWAGTWTASPYPVAAADLPPASLSNGVLRQVVRVSLGGSQIRLQLSNLSGNGPVAIRSVHVALCNATPTVDSSIDTTTDTPVAFSGAEAVAVQQGQEVWSDPIDFTVPPLGTVSITIAFDSVPSALTGHAGSRTTSYIQAGSSDVSVANLAGAATADHWYYISGIDVMADASATGIVAIGDSITDGRGTTTNGNNRWTDILAARLQADPATANVAVMNQGIGGTNLIGTTGTAAQARFNRDVLGQSGVKYAIVYDGVNDIGGGASFEAMRAVYDQLISAAHAQGLLIYGGTILPFNGSDYYSPANENVRQQVNAYIKSGVFDGVIDFDAALTDGGNPPGLQAPYAAWALQDGLHPGPDGYQRMGETPDLALFTR